MDSKNINIKLFTINLGFRNFNNNEHIDNYIKYLFSMSNKHKKNEYTYLNYAIMDDDSEIKEELTSTDENYNKFKERLNNKYNYDNLFSTIFYIGFFIEYENKLYTNLLEPHSSDNELMNLTWDEAILNQYLEDSQQNIEDVIDEINSIIKPFEPYNKGNIILLNEMIDNKDDKLNFIQYLIFSELVFNYSNFYKNNKISDLLYMSHIDQLDSFFHFHLLMGKKI